MGEARKQYEAPKVLRLSGGSTATGDPICNPGSSATDVCWSSGISADDNCQSQRLSAGGQCSPSGNLPGYCAGPGSGL